jgi:hypothetical protein
MMSDEDQRIAFFGKLYGFDVDFGDERAGGVYDAETAASTVLADLRRYSVRAVDDALTVRDFVFAIDEDGAFATEFVHHEAVVDDFLADVDGRTEGLEGDADHINGPNDAGAEAARLQ